MCFVLFRAAACSAGCANCSLKDWDLLCIIVLFFYSHLESFLLFFHLYTGFKKITHENVLHDLSRAWWCYYTVRLTLCQLL